MEKNLALVDCNNFFVSCERVFRPDLEGKPVIVLSSNDGCAIARSNEAKALGIRMGEPWFKVKDLPKYRDVVVFSSNFPLYSDLSNRVKYLLADFCMGICSGRTRSMPAGNEKKCVSVSLYDKLCVSVKQWYNTHAGDFYRGFFTSVMV